MPNALANEVINECFLPSYFPILSGEQISNLHHISESSKLLMWESRFFDISEIYESSVKEVNGSINHEIVHNVNVVEEVIADVQIKVTDFLQTINVFEYSGVWLCAYNDLCSLSNSVIYNNIIKVAMHVERGYLIEEQYNLLSLIIISEDLNNYFLNYKLVIEYSSTVNDNCLKVIGKFVYKASGLCTSMYNYNVFRLRIDTYKHGGNVEKFIFKLNNAMEEGGGESLVTHNSNLTSRYYNKYGSYEDMVKLKYRVDMITNEESNIVKVCESYGK
ncbi:hypothetical protein HWQ46_05155 [Shewanella sp. D64]|uniref:hypothetical protein n=1 Tax=unclassified Shewanella TaxID=196818 RepID=UPI0022BA2153|nr:MULTISPECIES: hypothetical protein [unclassified Shewanella]MEC4724939.1 hypothetical protein [Shewanella sp. D64]MEC4736268.1 hypothetical protein [Shewanella sp. E94]WBJ97668.1 hypothetical protein HWQ47_11525 [Shewanella sp. MTB7]